MAHNHLERLISEWYEYQGYYVKRNVQVGRRLKGGYECELDIIAHRPKDQKLVHVEPSMDADNWNERERRYKKKFDAGKKYIKAEFSDFNISEELEVEQIAVFGNIKSKKLETLVGGKIKTVGEILQEIFVGISDKKILSAAIPEHLMILRSFQFVSEYKEDVLLAWNIKTSKTTPPRSP